MNKASLLSELRAYEPEEGREWDMYRALIRFVSQKDDCFLRSNLEGQVTGSAWVVDSHFKKVLLVHHKKLNKWLQPGGHSDGEPDIGKVAMKEAEEETGLTSLRFFDRKLFDVDVHTIPAHKSVPEHLHYDIRYLITADGSESPVVSDESHDLRWVPLEKISHYNEEESVMRLVRKTRKLKNK